MATVMQTSKPRPAAPTSTRPHLRWWVEIAFVLVFYVIYSAVRNQFGSASVSPHRALQNATDIIDIERAVGLFQEQNLQSLFLDWGWFMRLWNIFYGTFHFVVTIFAMVWLYKRHPARYTKYRNILAVTTGLALIGFSLFPLMPPRLLDDCTTAYGGCAPHGFVDSLSRYGGLWSFDSGTMQAVSNQYAAMPSLHFGWSSWCCLALYPVIHNRVARVALLLYPWVTFFAIIVTANHYWLDAAGGAFVLALAFAITGFVVWVEHRVHFARLLRHAPPHTRSAPADPPADQVDESDVEVNAP